MYNEKPSNTLQITLETTADGILREYEPADIRLMFEKKPKWKMILPCRKDLVDLFRKLLQNIRQTGGKDGTWASLPIKN